MARYGRNFDWTAPFARRAGSGRRYGADLERGRRGEFAGPAPRRGGYDLGFRPVHPNDALGRALRDDAEFLVRDYLREERYGVDYARSLGRRIPGPGDRLRGVARRLSGRPDRGRAR